MNPKNPATVKSISDTMLKMPKLTIKLPKLPSSATSCSPAAIK